MRIRIATAAAILFFAIAGRAAGPEGKTDTSIPTFRVTAAEVHVTFTVAREKNHAVTDLSASDFRVLRDGHPVEQIVSFEPIARAPLSALVLTDISDSMLPGLPLERLASEWLLANSNASRDQVTVMDFGDELETNQHPRSAHRHLTSLYDALMEALPTLASYGRGRRALILLTDGIDNYSLHSLNEVIAVAQRYDVAVYAVTAHPGKKQYYRPDVLQHLCDETGGRYYDVRKPNEMTNAMAQINDELRNGYEVVFRPGLSGAGMHQLAIESTQRRLKLFYRSAYFQPALTEEVAAR